ncbi:amino acid transporter ANTL2, partial [Amborella trichopoda]
MGLEREACSSSHALKTPQEDSPLLPKSQPLSSNFKTFANILIAIVGAGVLGLPYTFSKTGWVSGILMLSIVAFLTHYCMMLLVYTRRKLDRENFTKTRSFGDLGFAVCGPAGRAAVDAMIVLSQAGFCVSYTIFVANSLSSVFPIPNILGLKPKATYIWGLFPFQFGLNSIKLLTHLAPLSIFADVVDISAMFVVIAEDLAIYLRSKPILQAFNGLSVIPYGLGVAVYAFEGIGMILPLEDEAKEKNSFGRILALAMGFITLLFGCFGALGYFAFGPETEDIITLNFGKSFLTDTVQLALAVNLFLTFPLMMNPVHEVIERRFNRGRYSLVFRFGMVFGICLVALLVPNFADFLSLVG